MVERLWRCSFVPPFYTVMEIYLLEDYKAFFPELSGSALTDRLIRFCLEEYGIRDAEIRRTGKGKPYTEGVFFSVSHSGTYFLCAISADPVGADIQQTRRINPERIARRFFTPEENALIRETGKNGFFRLWARKEAYSKYTGLGLEEIMRGTSVLDRDDVFFFDFQPEENIYCSCCIEKEEEKNEICISGRK